MRHLLLLALLLTACTGAAGDPTATAQPPAAQPTTAAAPAATLPPAETAVPATATPLPYTTPDWFREAVVYQVFVRSFYDANGDGIGDLDGITRKLDYIQSLGANTLWLTPIFASPSYHGYDTVDYYTINPDFGSKDDLAELVDAAHARDVRIILDYVAAHTSNEHPFFKDAYANPDSEYSDWYLWNDEQNLTYESFFGISNLPTINHGYQPANDYFLDIATYWLDLDEDGDYTDGIDGWRADYALNVVHSYWEQMRAAVKAANPEAVLLGEVWVRDPAAQIDYLEGEFDAVFDFPLYHALMGEPEAPLDGVLAGKSFVTIASDVLAEQGRTFPPEASLVRFLGNHDTDRLATELEDDPARLRLAPLLLAALPGPAMIYYGDEIGMRGRKAAAPLYDQTRREPMEWLAEAEGAGLANWFEPEYSQPNDGISVTEQEADPASLLNAYRAAFDLRREHPALARGAYTPLPVQPRRGVWAFWRHTGDQLMAAIFNLGAAPATLQLDLASAPVSPGESPVNALTGEPLALNPSAVTLEPASALIIDWTQ